VGYRIAQPATNVILSEASEYQGAAFGALNQFRRKSKDLRFP
jgi:hypothetical protein